ncbi:MAG: hypothetical protein FJ117_20130 [Deltaproteobacteria bacterium]|nr:hypothetical protein [Deltaproteobacteria bacterium]
MADLSEETTPTRQETFFFARPSFSCAKPSRLSLRTDGILRLILLSFTKVMEIHPVYYFPPHPALSPQRDCVIIVEKRRHSG